MKHYLTNFWAETTEDQSVWSDPVGYGHGKFIQLIVEYI